MNTIDNLQKSNQKLKRNSYHELTEKDFYPPEDTRYYKSGVQDITGGDNFANYAKEFFDEYEDELFDN